MKAARHLHFFLQSGIIILRRSGSAVRRSSGRDRFVWCKERGGQRGFPPVSRAARSRRGAPRTARRKSGQAAKAPVNQGGTAENSVPAWRLCSCRAFYTVWHRSRLKAPECIFSQIGRAAFEMRNAPNEARPENATASMKKRRKPCDGFAP